MGVSHAVAVQAAAVCVTFDLLVDLIIQPTVGDQQRHNLVRGRPSSLCFVARAIVAANAKPANPVASQRYALLAVVERGKVWACRQSNNDDTLKGRATPHDDKVCCIPWSPHRVKWCGCFVGNQSCMHSNVPADACKHDQSA